MGVVVRKATQNDLIAVIDLRLEFLGHVRGPDYQAPLAFIEKTVDFAEQKFGSNQLHIWLAEDSQGVGVGVVWMLLWPRPPLPENGRTTEAMITNMYVRPSHQRQGIGRRLLDECLATADHYQIGCFLLQTTDQARALYTSAGFIPTAEWMELRDNIPT